MHKICFALMTFDTDPKEKLICAYEAPDLEGMYIALDAEQFSGYSLIKQVENLNEMIIAVTKAADVKRGIKFSEYQRNDISKAL